MGKDRPALPNGPSRQYISLQWGGRVPLQADGNDSQPLSQSTAPLTALRQYIRLINWRAFESRRLSRDVGIPVALAISGNAKTIRKPMIVMLFRRCNGENLIRQDRGTA